MFGEKIASNILTDRLAMLHREGFITKLSAASNKSKFLYTLTEKAIALVPLMLDLIEWGSKFSPDGGPEKLLAQFSRNRTKTVRDLQRKLKKEAVETLETNPGIPVT